MEGLELGMDRGSLNESEDVAGGEEGEREGGSEGGRQTMR